MKCTECGHESNTYDVFLDLSLEINRASSLLKALQRFTSSEYLDGANKYICPKQKQKVRAAKCMTIDKAPAVLVVQLKRFEFSMFGHKINKKVCPAVSLHCIHMQFYFACLSYSTLYYFETLEAATLTVHLHSALAAYACFEWPG